jgi:hypothetical protein
LVLFLLKTSLHLDIMKHKKIYFNIFLILVIGLSSCDSSHPTNKKVRKYFESWEGIWEIQTITYVDQNTSFIFDNVRPQIEFSPCEKIIRNEGGMCPIQLTDQSGNINELWAVGIFTDEDNMIGDLRFDYSSNTQFSSVFNDSLLVVGDFVAQQFSNGTATLRGGRISNFADEDPLISQDVTIELVRK